MLDNQKREKQKEIEENIKKKNERIKLKKFLDMQIEERKKELEFLKSLDDEQGRICLLDNKKFNADKIKIDNIMKNINQKNLNIIKEQIQEKKKKEERLKELMSPDEYAINRDILEKAMKELENKVV